MLCIQESHLSLDEADNLSAPQKLGGYILISKEKDFHYWIKEILTNENMRECLSKLSLIYAKKHFKIEDKIEILAKICK